MPLQCVTGAMITCSFGTTPTPINILSISPLVNSKPGGNISDSKPILNVPTCGMCTSIANPLVASATAAAMGVLTPMPCVPAIAGPWFPGSLNILLNKMPALNNSCKSICAYGGVLSVSYPGQIKTQVK